MNGVKNMSKKYLIPLLLILSLSPSFATQNALSVPDMSFDWLQLFRFFVVSLKGFIVIQFPMLLILLSLWVWTAYMQFRRKDYPDMQFVERKYHRVQDTSVYIVWFGELGTYIGMFAAVIQLGVENNDKAAFALALGMAIATSILGKFGQIVGRGPERRLSCVLSAMVIEEQIKHLILLRNQRELTKEEYQTYISLLFKAKKPEEVLITETILDNPEQFSGEVVAKFQEVKAQQVADDELQPLFKETVLEGVGD